MRQNAEAPNPLAGRLIDPADKRYRYYVSRDLIQSSVEMGAKGWRIPAREVEVAVAKAIIGHLQAPETASAAISSKGGNMKRRALSKR